MTYNPKEKVDESKVSRVGFVFDYHSPPKEKEPKGCDRFVNLHNHSEYSLLDGMSRIERGVLSLDMDRLYDTQVTLVRKADYNKQPGVGLSDHGTLGGFFRFHTEAVSHNINPIIGIELYVIPDLKNLFNVDSKFSMHMTMFAKSYDGLLNLFKLNKIAWTKGFYRKPKVDYESMINCKGDTILLSGCGGDSPYLNILNNENLSKQDKWAKMCKLTEFFIINWGDDFYFEVMPHKYDQQVILNKALIKLSKKFDVKLVATNDTHYARKEDEITHEVLLAIQVHDKWDDPNRWTFGVHELYPKTRKEMFRAFMKYHSYMGKNKIKEALDSTMEIHGKVYIDIPKRKEMLPEPLVPDGMTKKKYFFKLLRKGWSIRKIESKQAVLLSEKLGISHKEAVQMYKDRIKHEWNLIDELGFPNYFLIVREVVNFARKNNIAVGPGRGSAAASVICYLLGITSIDPLVYDLMFERFISKYKVTLPDIDMDFEDTRRDEIIEWLKKRFGENNFVNIGTYGVLKGKMVLRDVSRVFDVPHMVVNGVTRHILERTGGDERKSMSLEDSFEEVDQMKRFDERFPKVRPHATLLEGTIRQSGVHACGVIVADFDLVEAIPIETRGQSGKKERIVVSAVTGKENEKLGLLKIDILGLKTLSVIKKALSLIKDGDKIDLEKIDLEDGAVLKEYTDQNYTGIFQYDSVGMRNTTDNFTFEGFEDVIAWNALYRPGTMRSGIGQQFKNRRLGKQEVPKIHPIYDNITSNTMGCLIYQEQISKAFNEMAGFTLADSDQIRIAISKSHGKQVIGKERKGFVDGCHEKIGMDKKVANKFFNQIVQFGSYGFNRAHAAAYAMISYWTMWLKHYYPLEYMTALLSRERDQDNVARFVREARRLNLTVKTPDINESDVHFSIGKGSNVIVAGFVDVKNVGEKASESIVEMQPFDNFYDFIDKVNRRVVNIRVIRSLVVAGAFDCWCKNTKYLSENIDAIVASKSEKAREQWLEQFKKWNKMEMGWDKERTLNERREVFALPSVEHPIHFYRPFIKNKIPHIQRRLWNCDQLTNKYDAHNIYAAGQIIDIKLNQVGDFDKDEITKRQLFLRKLRFGAQGSRYCNFDIEDDTGFKRISVAPTVYQRTKDIWEKGVGAMLLIKGQMYTDGNLVYAEGVVDLEELRKRNGKIETLDEKLLLDHPLRSKNFNYKRAREKYRIIPIKEVKKKKIGTKSKVIGVLVVYQRTLTRKNDKMVLGAILGDNEDAIDIMVWPELTEQIHGKLKDAYFKKYPIVLTVEKLPIQEGTRTHRYLVTKFNGPLFVTKINGSFKS